MTTIEDLIPPSWVTEAGNKPYHVPFIQRYLQYYPNATDFSDSSNFNTALTNFANEYSYTEDPDTGFNAADGTYFINADWQEKFTAFISNEIGIPGFTPLKDTLSLQSLIQYDYLVKANTDIAYQVSQFSSNLETVTNIMTSISSIMEYYNKKDNGETEVYYVARNDDGDITSTYSAEYNEDTEIWTYTLEDGIAVDEPKLLLDTVLHTEGGIDSVDRTALLAARTTLSEAADALPNRSDDATTESSLYSQAQEIIASMTSGGSDLTLKAFNDTWVNNRDVGFYLRNTKSNVENLNLEMQARFKKSMFTFEEFYKSAANIALALSTIMKTLARNIS